MSWIISLPGQYNVTAFPTVLEAKHSVNAYWCLNQLQVARAAECVAWCLVGAMLVGFRFSQICKRRGWFGIEELMMGASLSLLTVLTALACQDAREGFGVRKDNLITDGGNLQKAFFDFWMFQIFYKAVICFNKLAFFTLYLRLFPKLSVRRLCYATIFIFFWRFD